MPLVRRLFTESDEVFKTHINENYMYKNWTQIRLYIGKNLLQRVYPDMQKIRLYFSSTYSLVWSDVHADVISECQNKINLSQVSIHRM